MGAPLRGGVERERNLHTAVRVVTSSDSGAGGERSRDGRDGGRALFSH